MRSKGSTQSVPVLFGVGVWWCPKVANTGPTGREDGRCSDLHNWVGSRRFKMWNKWEKKPNITFNYNSVEFKILKTSNFWDYIPVSHLSCCYSFPMPYPL